MRDLWFYAFMDRIGVRNYRAKIMLTAFIGTHIPLLTMVSYFALKASADWSAVFATVCVTLVATLIGTGVTLFVLNHLLRPVLMTSRTLRTYQEDRDTGSLPTCFTDEAGTLMADATRTLTHLEQALDTLEFLDATSGLPNRKKLITVLQRRLSNKTMAACAIRFTNYGRLLETLDLEAAEGAARDIAMRLKAFEGNNASLYRVSGSDFVWLMEADETAAPASLGYEAVLRDLIGMAEASITVRGLTIDPMLRAGIALWPHHASTPDGLVDNALAAILVGSGDLRINFHSPAARRNAVERLQMEQDLRRALAREEFVLHYQPVVDLSIGQTVGAEALIRWQHPEQGLIPPGKFIGLAEQTGLIEPMGLWVMRQACLQVKDWNAAGLVGMKVAINLSARQFLDPDLIRHLDEALRVSGIDASQLEVELTETAAMANHDYTRVVFGKLRDLGVSIAIDDFGTGYASMSYLRKLPFDKLKIDREFVTNVHSTRDSQAICGALVTLANGLGLRVLAEGTESADEVRYLQLRGCDLYQGFYFSKPLAPAMFMEGLSSVGIASLGLVKGGQAVNAVS